MAAITANRLAEQLDTHPAGFTAEMVRKIGPRELVRIFVDGPAREPASRDTNSSEAGANLKRVDFIVSHPTNRRLDRRTAGPLFVRSAFPVAAPKPAIVHYHFNALGQSTMDWHKRIACLVPKHLPLKHTAGKRLCPRPQCNRTGFRHSKGAELK
jgi:hypothetical protein